MEKLKTQRIAIRLSDDEKEQLQAVADSKHLKLSTFLRAELLEIADKYKDEVKQPIHVYGVVLRIPREHNNNMRIEREVKPMDEKRSSTQSARLMVRMSPEDKQAIADAAWRSRKSISEFVRNTMLEASKKAPVHEQNRCHKKRNYY